ncbi:MAG: DUF1449 family protein [Candidatus Electrothrix sp. LOE1_4_5]|nr:DUF1449 family protein [Candidatus Electrothrix sp. AX1]MCI5118825.1 DUF1449 family protein [Candidatus Electrothrix gigas]MCI5180017.1 DUF1449 family protein [Candidatus Electrothrix gigas]MCI5181319.1 DUF1449 family protein [Candidatus Electrothrix gigas]MCI5193935.1 DUF1449 family protein [Candidatus Electrothrix gigas]
MLIFLTEAANLPFSVSLGLMIVFVLLEALSLLLGAGVSGILDSLLPDVDGDIDLDLPDSDPTTFMQILSWFRVGEVPLLMLILVALTAFGISGLLLQLITRAIIGELLPPFIAMIPACFCTIPLVRIIGGILNAYMPKDETSAVSEESLIGRSATLLAGTARQGKPVQGKVRDEHQQTHYVLIEPEHAEECIQSGETVILSQKKGAIYQAVHEIKERI